MPGRPAKEVIPCGIACHAVALCEGREASLDFLAAQKQIRAFNSTSNTQRATLRQKECRRKARWGQDPEQVLAMTREPGAQMTQVHLIGKSCLHQSVLR